MCADDNPSREMRNFTPAFPLLWAYDLIIAALTREATWRRALLRQLNPQAADVIADIGCGTGTFLKLIGRTAKKRPKLIGIDPDDRILKRARRKLTRARLTASFASGHLRDAQRLLAGSGVDKIVSSLVFHQVPLAEKRAGLAAIHAVLAPGGELHIADYGLQRTWLMRTLFRVVQRVDGRENTQPNADGILPQLMEEAGFIAVKETAVIPTLTGSISVYRAIRAQHAVHRGDHATHDTLQRLFRYKAWANDELLTVLAKLGAESPITVLATRALSHTYVVDRIFAAHMKQERHAYTSANLTEIPALETLSADIRASDRDFIDYVSALDRDRLAERIGFTFIDGAPGCMSREEMLLHVITHGAGHRGQVSAVMLLNALTPAADGFTTYLHKVEASARRRVA